MKIGLAHYSSISDISGVTTWLVGFCDQLMQAGHKVAIHLHHFGADPQQGSILPSLYRLGIETRVVRRTGELETDTRQTLRFLNQVQPDLFLPQCLHAHYCAAAHAGRQGLPWIFTMHSDDPHYWCVAEALTPESNGGVSVCVSQYLGQQLRKQGLAATPQVIPYGITLPKDHANFSAQPFRVVYSGRMVETQKCIHSVVRTLITACTASHLIEADLIGEGPQRAACEQLVRHAGLDDRIRFLGRVSPKQVSALLQRSQSILLMSEFEGLPVALLEAMAAGVVPVVRNIPSGIPELIQHEDTGLLVTSSPTDGAAALVRLSEEPVLWKKCSTNARLLVEAEYSAEHSSSLWENLIQQYGGDAAVSYPLEARSLRNKLPLNDPRFLARYSSRPSKPSRLHPRQILGRLKRILYPALK